MTKISKFIKEIAECISNDKDFIDEYNKQKRLNNFSYYASDCILDYLYNYDFLDKEYQDISWLKIKYYGKSYLVDLDTLFSLFKDCLSVG